MDQAAGNYDLSAFYDEDPDKLAKHMPLDPWKFLSLIQSQAGNPSGGKAASPQGFHAPGQTPEGMGGGQGLVQSTSPAMQAPNMEALGSGLSVPNQGGPVSAPMSTNAPPQNTTPGLGIGGAAGMTMLGQAMPHVQSGYAPLGPRGTGVPGPRLANSMHPSLAMPTPAGQNLNELYLRELMKRHLYGA